MNKGLLKNIIIILLLTIAVSSIFKYRAVLNEKYELLNTLGQVREQAATLEKEKQNLLQDIEKRKKLARKLKTSMKAGIIRLTKLFATNNEKQKVFDELSSGFSLLKMENAALREQKDQIIQQNESLEAKLISIEELKRTIEKLTKHNNQPAEIEEGNKGFLVKDGRFTYPGRVKINVIPAYEKE